MMERQRFSDRPCPVCGRILPQLLFRQSFACLQGASLMDGYNVVICGNCGFGFADDIPPQSVFDEHYRELSKYEETPITNRPPRIDQRLRDTAEIVAQFIPARHSRILEIGCASGGLLKALLDLGFTSVLGVDPSPGCIRAARESHGVPGVAATVFTVPPAEQPYDFLILTGVMEHIRDLDGAIQQFRRLLRKGGRVYLEVPDASRYDARLDAPFQEFSVEHINYFSETSLANLMRARGFRQITAGQAVRSLHEITCPSTYGLFEYTGEQFPIETDRNTESGLRQYIAGCVKEDARLRRVIQTSLLPDQRMIVWGVGTHTLRLLATGGLEPSKIALFADSNPKYQHRELCGIPVVTPEALKNRPEPILISSRGCQQAIQTQIQDGLGLTNPLILLYDRPQAMN